MTAGVCKNVGQLTSCALAVNVEELGLLNFLGSWRRDRIIVSQTLNVDISSF